MTASTVDKIVVTTKGCLVCGKVPSRHGPKILEHDPFDVRFEHEYEPPQPLRQIVGAAFKPEKPESVDRYYHHPSGVILRARETSGGSLGLYTRAFLGVNVLHNSRTTPRFVLMAKDGTFDIAKLRRVVDEMAEELAEERSRRQKADEARHRQAQILDRVTKHAGDERYKLGVSMNLDNFDTNRISITASRLTEDEAKAVVDFIKQLKGGAA